MAPIKIGTDCSGIEAPVQALQNLATFGVKLSHEFSCDVNAHAKTAIEANFPHKIWYDDLCKRDNKKAPYVDIYVAGFPCQPFSTAGLQQGFSDQRGRGKVFFKVLDYIQKAKPRCFILENVMGLIRINKGQYLKAILQELENLGTYNVKWQLMNTRQHGVPHSRNRWYCIGIKKSHDKGTFEFPDKIEQPPLELFLEPRESDAAVRVGPVSESRTARTNVNAALRNIAKAGKNPYKESCIVDCDSSASRSKWTHEFVPCITCSRGNGHWVTNRGRRLTNIEMHRLQGMNPTKFKVAVSRAKHGFQLGNSMSVCVLERIFVSLLPAAQLVGPSVKLEDRWKSGKALKELAKTRGGSFKKMDDETHQRLLKSSTTYKRMLTMKKGEEERNAKRQRC